MWMYKGLAAEEANFAPARSWFKAPLGAVAFLPAGSRIRTPVGVAAFPDPYYPPPPRSLAEKSYNITHWTDMPSGGHFAALEEPKLLIEDIRNFSRSLS
jgi:pimeloyl-ACP methyl ester carboxylesterase